MRSSLLPLSLAGFFLVFLGGLTLYFKFDDGLNNSSYLNRRAANDKASLNTRALEDSKITTKMNKVENEPSALFNDPAIAQAWGLKKSDAARAWSLTKGSRQVVVAVIDTGLDLNHEDLKQNLWTNPGEQGKDAKGKEKATNGQDDDGNGFVDDVHGWNFVLNNNKLADNHGHGTHIAGIIGAQADNKKGIVGIAPEVSMMILKYFDPLSPGADNLRNTVRSIQYAVKMGAHIINYSGGGLEFSQEEFDAISEARKKGILFVAAAGNEKSNSDKIPYYPADYDLDNIISVTAFNPSVEVLATSNWGVKSVHIAAPGQNVISTLPGNAYGFMTGTSQATAFVTGGAALIMSHKVGFKYDDVKKYILSTGDALASLAEKTKTSRKLNLYKALTVLDEDLTASGIRAVNSAGVRVLSGQQDRNSSRGSNGQQDPNASLDSTAQFGRDLMEALQRQPSEPKKDRLGNKPEF